MHGEGVSSHVRTRPRSAEIPAGIERLQHWGNPAAEKVGKDSDFTPRRQSGNRKKKRHCAYVGREGQEYPREPRLIHSPYLLTIPGQTNATNEHISICTYGKTHSENFIENTVREGVGISFRTPFVPFRQLHPRPIPRPVRNSPQNFIPIPVQKSRNGGEFHPQIAGFQPLHFAGTGRCFFRLISTLYSPGRIGTQNFTKNENFGGQKHPGNEIPEQG
jgi:hypothetical protein